MKIYITMELLINWLRNIVTFISELLYNFRNFSNIIILIKNILSTEFSPSTKKSSTVASVLGRCVM